MLYPVEKLLANRDNVLCARKQDTVRDALVNLMQNDFSQLPIVDDEGNLVGIISEQTITRSYYHVNDSVSLFDLTVDHCMTEPVILSPNQDIFEALERLQRTYAIVIVEGRKPIGLLTFYDTTHFFRNISEGLIFVEDVETTLREYVRKIYATEERMNQGLIHSFGRDGTKPRKEFDELTFGEQTNLITHPKNWADFESYFKPQPLFNALMKEARLIRNHLAHFRGELDTVQFDALRRTRDWLTHRPKPALQLKVHDSVIVLSSTEVQLISPHGIASQESFGQPSIVHSANQGTHSPFTQWLTDRHGANTVQLTLDQLDALLVEPLPEVARQHRSWWVNDTTVNRQSRTWLSAGWLVEDVDLTAATVTFHRTVAALYQLFYEDIIQRINARRPGLVGGVAARPKSWLSFGAKISGLSYDWTFAHGSKFCVELYIATGTAETNKRYFDQLFSQKPAIEERLGTPLNWDRLDKKGASKVRLERTNSIKDPPEQLEQAKQWGIDRMLDFVDVFQPRLQALSR
ncbi:MAG TPA: DUF4268 domain-containing protein, partial [Caldilineaceae bacterium]|nr:DUF4268 domain-containing protein [Caldilineaceae bacterium]